MNKSFLFILLFSILSLSSMSLFAEGANKASSISQVWWLGLFLGVLFYFAARFSWLLALVMAPLSVMFFIGSFQDNSLRENGIFDLMGLFVAASLLIIGSLLGMFFNIRASRIAAKLEKENSD